MASEEAEASAQLGQEEVDPQFAPVHLLTDKDRVEVTTGEESELELFKSEAARSKLFRFDRSANEWKERGTGDLRILQHKESQKIRLVMRRDKTHKVCANHYITAEMKLAPNVGSDRSWVYNVLADVSDGEATAETLAVRFANSDNANLFKVKFEEAQAANAKLALASSTDAPDAKGKDKETPASATTEADSDASPAFESAPPSATATTGEKKELSAEEEKAQLAAKHEQEDAKGSKDADGEAPPPSY